MLILVVLLTGSTTTTTTALVMATMLVVASSTITFRCVFKERSLSCGREVFAQLNHLVVVTFVGRQPGHSHIIGS